MKWYMHESIYKLIYENTVVEESFGFNTIEEN